MGTWILSRLWRLHCPSSFCSLFPLCSILSWQICLPGTLFETFFHCFCFLLVGLVQVLVFTGSVCLIVSLCPPPPLFFLVTWLNHIGFKFFFSGLYIVWWGVLFFVNNWILQSFIDQRENLSENDNDNYNDCTTSEKQLADRKFYRTPCFPLLEFIFSFFVSICNPGFWTSKKRYMRHGSLYIDKPLCKAFEVLFDNMHFSLKLENSSCFL